MILAIDPGKDKSGVALYDPVQGIILFLEIILTLQFSEWLKRIGDEYAVKKIILGNGTNSGSFRQKIIETLGKGVMIEMIDEAYSTLEAQRLYFKLYPPKGLRRLLPSTLQTPGRPVDDLVAVILLKRYLGDMPKLPK